MVAILGALALLIPLLQSDTPPLSNIDRVSKLAQNFDKLQAQQQQLLEHQKQSDQVQVSIALTIYAQQINQAQAQIEAAKREGKRDLAAEALKQNAENSIMTLTSQIQPASGK